MGNTVHELNMIIFAVSRLHICYLLYKNWHGDMLYVYAITISQRCDVWSTYVHKHEQSHWYSHSKFTKVSLSLDRK